MIEDRKITYNGWTNRETWLIGVHNFFDHDQLREMIKIQAYELNFWLPENKDAVSYSVIALNDSLGGKPRALELWLADWMAAEHDEFVVSLLRDDDWYLHDLVYTAAKAINWLEIAEHYRDEILVALSDSSAWNPHSYTAWEEEKGENG
tara:strand:- start:32 stop:478 length:447 start_codon:yes stop_codon:yes gene_type:complete